MKKQWMVVCAVAVIASGAALAADVPAAPKPGPEHEKLGYFVGNWTMEGTMKDSPMGPGGKTTGKDKCDWFAGRFAVVCRSTGNGPMGQMKGLGILSYSADAKAYTYYGTDSMGMTMLSVPKGKREGDTWTYDDESPMGGKMVKSRYIIKELPPDKYRFTWEVQGEDGNWAVLMEGTNTREGAGAKKSDRKDAKKDAS